MSYLVYNGKRVVTASGKYVGKAVLPEVMYNIYAGVDTAQILKSTNSGQSYQAVDLTTTYNPYSVSKLTSNLVGIGNAGDIITGEDSDGFIYNVTQDTEVSIPQLSGSYEAIDCLHHSYTGYLWASFTDSSIYLYDGADWYKWAGNIPGEIMFMDSSVVGGFGYFLLIGTQGIYNGSLLKQSGNFYSGLYYDNSTFFASDYDASIWRTYTWGDTWEVAYSSGLNQGTSLSLVKGNNGRILWAEGTYIRYTDYPNDFGSGVSSFDTGNIINSIAHVNGDLLVAASADGAFYQSTNNGATWTLTESNPEGISSIYWVIKE